jgi:glycosyltransferase involved in cell wall biosynthesis
VQNGRSLELDARRLRHIPKVLHIVPALFGANDGILGGAERYAFELARHMANVAPTTLLSFGGNARDDKIDNLRIRILSRPWYVRGQRTNPFHFGMIGEILRADVIHCHQQHVLTSSVAAFVGRAFSKRVFVTDLGGGGWDISGYISTDRWFHGHLHISEYSRKVFGHDSLSRAYVILGGVDSEKFSPGAASADRKTVLFVGRLLPHKGINYLIEALPPDLTLRIVGQPHNPDYAKTLHQLANGKNVIFEEGFDDNALANAYREALCVVLPSVYIDIYGKKTNVPELLGQTLLEGMASEIPAICTNVASMPEIVVDGATGFIVPPNNVDALHQKLLWLRDHPVEAQTMGVAGRTRVIERFNWKSVVDRCFEIYAN